MGASQLAVPLLSDHDPTGLEPNRGQLGVIDSLPPSLLQTRTPLV